MGEGVYAQGGGGSSAEMPIFNIGTIGCSSDRLITDLFAWAGGGGTGRGRFCV